MITLLHGDCLDLLPYIPSGSVDAIICDPPYGTTACRWDSVIPLTPMWGQLKRLIKPNGAVVMTASQPFTTILISSNINEFKYCWVWEKEQGTGHRAPKRKDNAIKKPRGHMRFYRWDDKIGHLQSNNDKSETVLEG